MRFRRRIIVERIISEDCTITHSLSTSSYKLGKKALCFFLNVENKLQCLSNKVAIVSRQRTCLSWFVLFHIHRVTETRVTISKHSFTISKHLFTISKHSFTISKHSFTISKHSFTFTKWQVTKSDQDQSDNLRTSPIN